MKSQKFWKTYIYVLINYGDISNLRQILIIFYIFIGNLRYMLKSRFLLPFLILAMVCCLGVLSEPAPEQTADNYNAADIAWMLTASGLVLLMTPGLSFFYGGMVSKKNIISSMLQSFIALGVITLLYVVLGFSLCFGDSFYGLIGNPFQYFMFKQVGLATHPTLSPSIPFLLFALFQLKFAIITPALITGSFAERVKFNAYLLFICLFSIFIYAPLAHWTWHPDGFLKQWGVLDFAGGTVVHMSAGYAALAGAIFLGPRTNYNHHQQHDPANIPYVMLGTGMLWFGWFGFNAGCSRKKNIGHGCLHRRCGWSGGSYSRCRLYYHSSVNVYRIYLCHHQQSGGACQE